MIGRDESYASVADVMTMYASAAMLVLQCADRRMLGYLCDSE